MITEKNYNIKMITEKNDNKTDNGKNCNKKNNEKFLIYI